MTSFCLHTYHDNKVHLWTSGPLWLHKQLLFKLSQTPDPSDFQPLALTFTFRRPRDHIRSTLNTAILLILGISHHEVTFSPRKGGFESFHLPILSPCCIRLSGAPQKELWHPVMVLHERCRILMHPASPCRSPRHLMLS